MGLYGIRRRREYIMQLQKISSVSYQKKNDIVFKNKLTFDIGASDPRGSLKILVQDNDGEDLFEYKGFVNDTTKGFKDNDDFTNKIAKAVDIEGLLKKDMLVVKKQMQQANLSAAEVSKFENRLDDLQQKHNMLKGQSKEDKKLTGFALLLPGTLKGHVALIMANLKKIDKSAPSGKSSLLKVDLDNIISKIEENGDVELADKFKFMPVKDLSGTGLGITKKIINSPEYGHRFSKGFYAVAIQTGGGFGAVDIKVKADDEVDIETDECGHDLFHDDKTGKELRLGKLGASTGSVIENYARELGITKKEDIGALIQTGLAQLATQSEIKLNNIKDEAAINVLLATGKYEQVNHKPETTRIRIKDKCMDDFNRASSTAIKDYAYALALHAITKINRGANLYVVSGPLAMGLNDTIMSNPEVYGADNMRDLIFKTIDRRVGDDVTCNVMREGHDFDIVCDKSMSVADNTSGGALLLEDNTNLFARRGEWLKVPAEAFKD